MTFVLPALAAVGLTILILGLPLFREPRFGQRVDPYVRGLHGRPSALLDGSKQSAEGALRGWIQARSAGLGAGSSRHLEERLAAAGEDLTASGFRIEQLTWGTAAAVGAWSLGAASVIARIAIEPRAIIPLSVIAFALGWLGRDWWLTRKIEERKSAIQDELPTAIDLVTLSIMAGESIPAALDRSSRVLGAGIGTEFAAVVADIRAGSPATEALYSLKRRFPGSRITRFVDALVTALERGSPLAETLMAQSDDVREERRRLLLESGGRREILMLVPVVFLILPVVVVFALLPGLVSLNLLVP